MRSLLHFLYRYKAFVVFMLLELASITLICNRERYQAFPSFVIGRILSFISEVRNYPLLKEENAKLRAEVETAKAEREIWVGSNP